MIDAVSLVNKLFVCFHGSKIRSIAPLVLDFAVQERIEVKVWKPHSLEIIKRIPHKLSGLKFVLHVREDNEVQRVADFLLCHPNIVNIDLRYPQFLTLKKVKLYSARFSQSV